MRDTEYAHVSLGDDDLPYVSGSLPLHTVVSHFDRGETPETIAGGYDILVSAVYSGLAYYHDHVDAVRAEMARRDAVVETLRAELGDSPAALRLRRLKAALDASDAEAEAEREADTRRRA